MLIRYLDSSVAIHYTSGHSPAAVKWINNDFKKGAIYFSSQLLRTEMVRTYLRLGDDLEDVTRFIRGIILLDLDNDLASEAAAIKPIVKTLDALHLASALRLSDFGPVTVVTHDAQMAQAAQQLGLAAYDPVTDDQNRTPVA